MKSSFKEVAVSIALLIIIASILILVGLTGAVDVNQMTISESIPKTIVVVAVMFIAVIVMVKCSDERTEYDKL